jgi:peptidoglycan/LPS O-acetylase OafA/YrhL
MTVSHFTLPYWVEDNLIGLATVCLIISCTRSVQTGGAKTRPFVLRLFSARIPVQLGAFSYSLYLIHLPAWWTLQPVMKKLHLSTTGDFAFQLLIGIPYVLLAAYGFYWLFERHFVSGSPRPLHRLALEKAN